MIFGFNTDVKVGDHVYHVQTEDRGAKNPVVDSVIYHKGRILDRRRTAYVLSEKTPEQIKEMVTAQHRDLVDSIKTGAFVPGAEDELMSNVTVELLNPDALAQNGRLLFHLKVPAGSRVDAFLDVNGKPAERSFVKADQDGNAEVSFLMPQGPEAAVVFRAVTRGASQTVKFSVKQR